MDSATVIAALKRHEAELRGLGVVRLSLFGSVARAEADEDSDVDLAAVLTECPRGFDYLERKDRIRDRLQEILGRPVDLIEEPSLRPRVQRGIEKDRVLAF